MFVCLNDPAHCVFIFLLPPQPHLHPQRTPPTSLTHTQTLPTHTQRTHTAAITTRNGNLSATPALPLPLPRLYLFCALEGGGGQAGENLPLLRRIFCMLCSPPNRHCPHLWGLAVGGGWLWHLARRGLHDFSFFGAFCGTLWGFLRLGRQGGGLPVGVCRVDRQQGEEEEEEEDDGCLGDNS